MNNNNSNNTFKKFNLVNFCEIDKYASQSYCAMYNVDPTLNLGNIKNVDENTIEDFNVIFGGSPCFPSGTKVYTNTGYRKIEKIKVGDKVLTHKNRFKKVTKIGSTPKQKVMEISAMGMLKTQATPNHPFMVVSKTTKGDLSLPYFKQLGHLDKEKDYLCSPVLKYEKNPFNLTEVECYMIGRYIADGYIVDNKDYHRVEFCIGKHKLQEFKNNIKDFPHKLFYYEKVDSFAVRTTNMDFLKLCALCGVGAKTKKIPQVFLNLPIPLLRKLLEGYMSGDGYFRKKTGVWSATSVSPNLIFTLQLAIQKCYKVGCTIMTRKMPDTIMIKHRVAHCSTQYIIEFKMDYKGKSHWIYHNEMILYPIRNIKEVKKTKRVYNLEVKEDHTYLIPNCFVHNCQDFSVAGNQKGAMWECKNCGHKYNPLTVHYDKRKYCPSCNSENITKTRSSLVVEFLRIIKAKKPKWGIYENVPNITSKQFLPTFMLFIEELKEYGYNVYYNILNARKFGIPQNRERLYLVFILKKYDNEKFLFPNPFYNGIEFKDMLENNVDSKYYLSTKNTNSLFNTVDKNKLEQRKLPIACASRGRYDKDKKIKQKLEINSYNASNTITTVQKDNLVIDNIFNDEISEEDKCFFSYLDTLNSKYIKNAYYKFYKKHNHFPKLFNAYDVIEYYDTAPTLTTNCGGTSSISSVLVNEKECAIRRLTPKECFRLQGFSDELYERAKSSGISDSQLYIQAGNSIVIDVLYYIILALYKSNPELFRNIAVSSFFSGIGAFEQALEEVLEDTKTFTVGSLFAGIGGIDKGFETAKYDNANYELLWANEMDKYANVTYQHNFNNKLIQGNIVNILQPVSKDDLVKHKEILKQPIDILTAGFPCQPFSIAGTQKGFADKEKGNLFYSIIDLLQQLDIKYNTKPRIVFLENVKNLLSHDKGNTFKTIKTELENNGYTVYYTVLNTYEYSNIPQNRERIYIVAFRDKIDYNNFIENISLDLPKQKIDKTTEIKIEEIKNIIDFPSKNISDKYFYTKEKYPKLFTDNGINLGNEITEKYCFYQCRRNQYVRQNKNNVCPTLTANMGTGGHNVPLILSKKGIRKLTPEETFKLQGFPIHNGYELPKKFENRNYPDSQLYKQSGNAVSVPIINFLATEILKAIDNVPIIQTLEDKIFNVPNKFKANYKNVANGLDLLDNIKDNTIKTAFFDPQYRGILDKMKYGNEGARQKARTQLAQMSEDIIVEFIKEINRVLINSGHLFLWIDKFHLCQGIDNWIANTDLQIVDLIVWDKGKIGMGYRSRRKSEYLLVLQKKPIKAKGYWTDHSIPDVWQEKVKKVHPHSKPTELQQKLIEATTKENDIVLDPASGGYSVFECCKNCNRNFVGSDLLSEKELENL